MKDPEKYKEIKGLIMLAQSQVHIQDEIQTLELLEKDKLLEMTKIVSQIQVQCLKESLEEPAVEGQQVSRKTIQHALEEDRIFEAIGIENAVFRYQVQKMGLNKDHEYLKIVQETKD